ncbi:MAG: VCBS repeat-containing protein [Acidobacteria bacterium]|nr:VCBS repeat-containing protein [Acidobacteriota bacterium]
MRARHTLSLVVTTLVLTAGPASRTVTCQRADVCGSGLVTEVSVQVTGSTYRAASGNPTGFFHTGQDADILLSGIDFNNTGGGLLFNHQAGIATDGTHLILADMFNHRVLIWNTLPTGNVAPDVVLGQIDFTNNTPGTGRDQMNMPVQVSTDGQHIAVADSYNNRILIWNKFPMENGVPADMVLEGEKVGTKSHFSWPWGVWTNGQKLVISGTGSANIVIWKTFPTSDNAPGDIVVTGSGKFGTPRMVMSNGTSLAVGDHNAKVPGKLEAGTYFWKTFPTADEAPYDFFMEDPDRNPTGWFRGLLTSDGRLFAVASTLYIWNAFPTDDRDAPDVAISGYNFHPALGDAGGVAVAGSRMYVSSGNSNKIVVYNSIPTSSTQVPDFAIGSSDICTNTLHTNFFITNPVPASNGTSLFVASDFDAKLSVWRNLPDQSGAHPDFVYSLPSGGPWGVGLSGRTLALAGGGTVWVWDDLPLNGELPSRKFSGGIGSVKFGDLRGIALDDRYFYVADAAANKVYVWVGVPSAASEPAFTLAVTKPYRLSSDGTYLAVTATHQHKVFVYPVASLSASTTPVAVGGSSMFNLPQGAHAAYGRLFVADMGNHRVHVWSDIQNALAGQQADIVLGETNFDDVIPDLGRDKTYWPSAVSFDGRYLWVGEFKFSNRLLRFSPGGNVQGATAGAIDLNGDRKGDVFRYNAATGQWSRETTTTTGFSSSAGSWSADWTVRAADFNKDRLTDFFLYNARTGAWFKAIATAAGTFTYFSSTWSSGWNPYIIDLDGDGKSDVFLYNASTGAWFKCVSLGDGTGEFSYVPGTWSPGWIVYPADFDGNGKADLFLYSRATGQWFRATNDGGAGFTYATDKWSNIWDIYPGDFNGDGKSDLFLYNTTTGQWFICTNTGTSFSYTTGSWASGWTVNIADFDGNGKADVFLYSPTTGQWFECVNNGAAGFSYYTGTWSGGWQAFITDFNNDGRSDVLLYSSTTGSYNRVIYQGKGAFSYETGTWAPGLTIVATTTTLP